MAEEKSKLTLVQLKNLFNCNEWALPNWTDLVLEQFEANELADDGKGNKYPRVRGLRRIGSYLAAGVYIDCDVIHCSEQYAACRAVAMAITKDDATKTIIKELHASSMAEATPANVNNEMIAKHLLATAESRAEGRCWTKVLKLNCLTAEEMSLSVSEQSTNKDSVKDIDGEESCDMLPMQKKMINKRCKEFDINLEKFAKNTCEKYNLDVQLHNKNGKISKTLAAKIIERFDEAIREEKPVPEEFKGYVKE